MIPDVLRNTDHSPEQRVARDSSRARKRLNQRFLLRLHLIKMSFARKTLAPSAVALQQYSFRASAHP